MPKGRHYAPSTDRDGIWYGHRGLQKPGPIPILRENVTSTGLMLTAPFDPDVSSYPPPPPQPYIKKDARKFKTVNTFSSHDNRNSFQEHGVYFGNGRDTRFLGRQLTAPESRQHNTEKDFLKHYGRKQSHYEYNTVYTNNYEGNPCQASAPSHRRFAKTFPELQSGSAKLTTTTTSVYKEPDVPHKTPTNVLAVT